MNIEKWITSIAIILENGLWLFENNFNIRE